MSSTQSPGSAYFCHQCQQTIQPLMTPGPTCPRCNGQFVEELDSVQASAAQEDDDDDDEDAFDNMNALPFLLGGGGARGQQRQHYQQHQQYQAPGAAPQLDIGGILRGVLGNLANAGNEHEQRNSQDGRGRGQGGEADNNNTSGPDGASSTGSNGYRSGGGSFGPINFRWGYASGSNTMGSHAAFGTGGNAAGRSSSTPPTLNEFLRGSFPQGHPDQEHDTHFHDDGMGGAGAAADGRFFNHDNRQNVHDAGQGQGAGQEQDQPGRQQNYPPELAALRELFGNLFGGIGDGPAGTLVNMLGDSLLSGRSGDYVFGQQGLDDVITQLMEQTRGSTAPPPATDDVIKKLDRFNRKNLSKVRQARNRECSTCMDSFEDEEARGKTDASLDSNRPVESTTEGSDDPPEVPPDNADQQDELVMMPCRHLFHEDCLVPWLKTSGTCPVCRVRLEGVPPQPEQPGQSSNPAHASTSGASTTIAPTAGTQASARPDDDATMSSLPRYSPTPEDLDNETPQQRRERMRRAAEARAARGEGAEQPSMPGSFGQPPPLDDLD